jgi:hypothetical protein
MADDGGAGAAPSSSASMLLCEHAPLRACSSASMLLCEHAPLRACSSASRRSRGGCCSPALHAWRQHGGGIACSCWGWGLGGRGKGRGWRRCGVRWLGSRQALLRVRPCSVSGPDKRATGAAGHGFVIYHRRGGAPSYCAAESLPAGPACLAPSHRQHIPVQMPAGRRRDARWECAADCM